MTPVTNRTIVMPKDIVNGLGNAPRNLLAVCIAMFEDSTLMRRMDALYDKWKSRMFGGGLASANSEAIASTKTTTARWMESKLSDDELRVVLWIYLREAFALPEKVCFSEHSARISCDDLVAGALRTLEPGWLDKAKSVVGLGSDDERPNTLDALARTTLAELMSQVLNDETGKNAETRRNLLNEARSRIEQLNHDDRTVLLNSVNSDKLNDAALTKVLITGGGLTAFSTSVGLAGFSAYILAAQASAFIPLVSGPALVSFVSVLSNPITVVATTGGMIWWLANDATTTVRAEVAVRILSLLAMHGLGTGGGGIQNVLKAFSALAECNTFGDLDTATLAKYKKAWDSLKNCRVPNKSPHTKIARLMDIPADMGGKKASESRWRQFLSSDREEVENAAALSVLTLGDIAYNAAAIDPTVLRAADFARIEDLSERFDFAAFANNVEAMDPASKLGAINDIKGYVAERVVASRLVEMGHQVEFPSVSNQAGWDISVDGIQFQVKDTDSLSYLGQHFEKHGYQYPLIANAEIAQHLEKLDSGAMPDWAHHVYFVEGYSNDVVQHVTERSLAAGGHMLHPHISLFTLAISGFRNYRRSKRGEITGQQAIHEVLLDGGTRMGLSAIGGYAGSGIGLLVFGPAGALIFGTVTPILSQMQSSHVKKALDEWTTSDKYVEWETQTHKLYERLSTRLKQALKNKYRALKKQLSEVPEGQVSAYVRWRMTDEVIFLREMWYRLKLMEECNSVSLEIKFKRLLEWLSVSTIYPAAYQYELEALSKSFSERPPVSDRIIDRVKGGPNFVARFAQRKWRDFNASRAKK